MWRFLVIGIFASSAWAESDLSAAAFYRFVDDAGRVQLSDKIPPKFVGQGYEVLDVNLFVIDRVAPALTPAQIVERDRRRALEAEANAQRAKDQQLLDRFPSLEILANAERADLDRLKLQVDIAQQTLALQSNALAQLRRQAAREERNGSVSLETLEAVTARELQVLKAEQAVTKREREIADTQALYQARRQRLVLITQN